jgi:hypothetical protein
MWHYVALVAILIMAIIWAIFRLVSLLRKQNNSAASSPTIESTNTDSSIAIIEDNGGGGVKKSSVYNVNKESEQQNQRLIVVSNKGHTTGRAKKVMSDASEDSLRSKNSFGFIPSIRTVAPLANRGKRETQNFLMLLDSLEPIEDEDARRRKQQPRKPFTTASSSGIEANSSDETASQTLIGKELDRSCDIGEIKLDYIKIHKTK